MLSSCHSRVGGIRYVVTLRIGLAPCPLQTHPVQLHSPSEAPMDPDHDAETIFETIEQLLQTVSPGFESAQRSALMAKLESLSDLA